MHWLKRAAVAAAAVLIAPYVLPAPQVDVPAELLAASDELRPQPHYRFTSDGCSGGLSVAWRAFTRRPPPFEHCCVAHDFSYWKGGTYDERRAADRALERCVTATGHRALGFLMYEAVRLGGTPYAPTAWRWPYGWRWPHGYD